MTKISNFIRDLTLPKMRIFFYCYLLSLLKISDVPDDVSKSVHYFYFLEN